MGNIIEKFYTQHSYLPILNLPKKICPQQFTVLTYRKWPESKYSHHVYVLSLRISRIYARKCVLRIHILGILRMRLHSFFVRFGWMKLGFVDQRGEGLLISDDLFHSFVTLLICYFRELAKSEISDASDDCYLVSLKKPQQQCFFLAKIWLEKCN